MRVLVIGGTGFIGPDVVRLLREGGHEVAIVHRGRSHSALPKGVREIRGDRHSLADIAPELRASVPDVVLDMFPMNDADVAPVADAVCGVARRLVAISSQDVYRVYGRFTGIEPGEADPVPYAEDAPLREQFYPYRGKLTGEDDYEKLLVERAVLGDAELQGTVLRLPMVYGPRDDQHRLYEYLRRMDDARPAILLDERAAQWRRTRGYVTNVAAAIALAVTDERAAGRVYNVGEPVALTLADWVRAIGRAAGWNGAVLSVPPDGLPAHLARPLDFRQDMVADTSRLRCELGYTEPVPLDEALRRTVEWERANPPANIAMRNLDYAAEDAAVASLREQGNRG
jgi:nucleoside-diphosphate-sugar epimerase